jgi:hypothetical protein
VLVLNSEPLSMGHTETLLTATGKLNRPYIVGYYGHYSPRVAFRPDTIQKSAKAPNRVLPNRVPNRVPDSWNTSFHYVISVVWMCLHALLMSK